MLSIASSRQHRWLFNHANTDLHGKKSCGLSVFARSAFHSNISYNTAQSSIVVVKIAQIFQSLPTPLSFLGPCWLCQYTCNIEFCSVHFSKVLWYFILRHRFSEKRMQLHLLGCWDDWLRAHWASLFATCETPLHVFMLTCEQGRRADKPCGGTSPFLTPPLPFPSPPSPFNCLSCRLPVPPLPFHPFPFT